MKRPFVSILRCRDQIPILLSASNYPGITLVIPPGYGATRSKPHAAIKKRQAKQKTESNVEEQPNPGKDFASIRI
jgi:hypothetical protein